MENPEKIAQVVKRARFALPEEGESHESPSQTLLARAKKNQKHDKSEAIKNLCVRLSQSGQYETLRETLDCQFIDKSISGFFAEQGPFLLRYGISHSKTAEFLKFMRGYIPIHLLQQALRSDNYYAFESFLIGSSEMEKRGLTTPEYLESVRNKLRELLKIDQEGLESYMDNPLFNKRFSEGVKAVFQQILEEHTSKHSIVARC